MGFFADVPEPEREFAVERSRPPEWAGPPENAVGATVPLDLVLANTGDIAITVGGMTAYPTGLAFNVVVVRRPGTGDDDEPFMDFHQRRRPEGQFRLGVQFSDGRKVVDGHDWPGRGDGPRLMPGGGSGGGLHYSQEYWLWPLPPDGPLLFACEFPARGVAETVTEIAAGPIREAAARAVELWPDERPVGDEW